MDATLPCPVCGKQPKIKRYSFGDEHCVQIICKPLFRQQHESALAYSENGNDEYDEAIRIWNGRVKAYKERNNNAIT